MQVGDPALDAALADRGWQASPPVDLLAGPLDGGLPAGPPVAARTEGLDEEWLQVWRQVDGRYGPAEQEVALSMLRLVRAPVGYARVHADGQVVGVARGVAQGPWLGVFSVAVLPGRRRRGLAADLLRALRQWGEGQGAVSAYLQVARDNPARGLYAGLSPAGSYRYRTLLRG